MADISAASARVVGDRAWCWDYARAWCRLSCEGGARGLGRCNGASPVFIVGAQNSRSVERGAIGFDRSDQRAVFRPSTGLKCGPAILTLTWAGESPLRLRVRSSILSRGGVDE